MAVDTVNAAARLLDPDRPVHRSRTKRQRLIGGHATAAPSVDVGLNASQLKHLVGRHGSETAQIIDLCRHDPSLGEPLVPGLPYIKAEAIFAARHEMAHTLSDVLARRTRAAILDRDATTAAASAVADVVGPELGWDAAERARQVAALAAEIDAEARPIRPLA
jgi:glycerol-3-phosphate dehydrogenase